MKEMTSVTFMHNQMVIQIEFVFLLLNLFTITYLN